MLCNSCNKQEAAVIVQMSVNGQLLTRHLCPACAQQMHIEIAKSLSRAGEVLNTLRQRAEQAHADKAAQQVPEAICSACGHAIRELTGSSHMGCPKCYDAFRERIAQVIGGKDARPEPAADPRKDIHRQLEEAVIAENYELAAALRDQLRNCAKEGDTGA